MVNSLRICARTVGALTLGCAVAFVVDAQLARAAEDSTVCAPPPSEARRRPGNEPEARPAPPCDPSRLPAPRVDRLPEPEAMVNRWRIVESLGYADNRLDPYAGNNPLKGDRPVHAADGFLSLSATSSSLLEPRNVPAAGAGTGTVDQLFFSENASFDAVLYKGDTVFRPPDYQFRLTPVITYSTTRTDAGTSRSTTLAVQALFFEKHLRDVSDHYDFDSLRVGIQPMTSDFRGFLMLDQPLGVRLFGTRSSNRYQYNIGWFRPLPKNGARLNDIGAALPDDDLFVANLYRQDLLRPGLNAAITVIYDHNRARGVRILPADGTSGAPATFVENARHNYDIAYLGSSADGHFGRLNVTGSLYYAIGQESPGTLLETGTRVRAFFAAGEFSVDSDWARLRLSALHASGDADPQDSRATGFAGLNSNPLFAGADSSFFLHQRLPLSPGVDLKQRDRLFDDLRPSSAVAQSSFIGPGLSLLGLGADFDLTPRLRLSLDANQLWFAQVAPLSIVSGRTGLGRDIGQDLSLNAFYRPFVTQNFIVRFSGAMLNPGRGYRGLYGGGTPYSFFCNLIVTY